MLLILSYKCSCYSGIANFFGTLLPGRFGLIPGQKCVEEINAVLRAYYTNPYRSKRESDISQETANSVEIDVLYSRGFAFLLQADGLLRDATDGKASLDDVALSLLNRRRSGQRAGQKDWISELGRLLDERRVARDLKQMLNGDIVIPTAAFLPGYSLHRCDKEPFELGFAFGSLASHIVVDVVPESRASAAGVRNGDRILSSTRMIRILNDADALMELEIRRGDHTLDIRYRPRGFQKWSCWEFRPSDSLSPSLLL
jgi:predicted metalloprotease with PDZ domain